MNTKRFLVFLVISLSALLLAQSVLAMSSTHYQLAWFVPLTGSGGAASSTHYAVNFTVGQTVVGRAASDHAQASLGYWTGVGALQRIYLPLILRS